MGKLCPVSLSGNDNRAKTFQNVQMFLCFKKNCRPSALSKTCTLFQVALCLQSKMLVPYHTTHICLSPAIAYVTLYWSVHNLEPWSTETFNVPFLAFFPSLTTPLIEMTHRWWPMNQLENSSLIPIIPSFDLNCSDNFMSFERIWKSKSGRVDICFNLNSGHPKQSVHPRKLT